MDVVLSLFVGAFLLVAWSDVDVGGASCGPHALGLVASFLRGNVVSSEDLDRAFRGSQMPCSVLDLEVAAQRLGLETRTIRIGNWSQPPITGPCVIHLSDLSRRPEAAHFVACFGQVNGALWVTDFPLSPRGVNCSVLGREGADVVVFVGHPGDKSLDRIDAILLRRRVLGAAKRLAIFAVSVAFAVALGIRVRKWMKA